MYRLSLFGIPTLERDGAPLTGRATHRHRLALLALLALAPGQRLSREKLIAYLWPERDGESGRNLLKVGSYVLRSALGDDVLLSEGDDLRHTPALIETDVAEFEIALQRGDRAKATALYRGAFLDGFFLSDAPEFERWTDRERDRLAAGYRSALEALGEASEKAGDFAGAVEWWRTRAAHDPYDSRVALRLMQAMEASGNRAGALQHAAVHDRLLEDEFGMGSPAELTAFVERMRQEPLAVPQVDRRAQKTAPILAASVPLTSPPRRPRWLPAAALVMLLAFVSAFALWPRAADPENSIVVLPFTNLSPEQDVEYFSDGLTEEIITRLAAVRGLKVISRTSAMHYKGSKQPLPQIAKELNVAHVLEGSVRHDGGRVRISAQLIDARGDGHVWAENYEHTLHDSFRVQEDIASEVVRALELELSTVARKQISKLGTRDAEAYELYRRGRFVWETRTQEGHEQAIAYFQRAIARDSSFANAYAGLSDVYLTGFQLSMLPVSEAEAYSRINWAAERALALDEESADAHTSFAIALWWQRNWPGTERELRRALELNPGHATARTWYTLLLAGQGRTTEAFRQSRAAFAVDPLGVVVVSNHGWLCYQRRDYDCAIEYFKRSIEISARWPQGHRGLALVYAQAGRKREAVAEMEKAMQLAPRRFDFIADLAYVQARAGMTQEARETLRAAKQQPLEPFNIGRAHIALSEPDSAFAWLARANWRWPHRAFRGDPALDPIRNDRRFTQLNARIERAMGLK